jgi:hypothetical protein
LIGRREVTSDIALCQSAIQRVGDGVHRDIGIRMPHKGLIMRDFNATQYNMIAGSEPVNVIPIAQPNLHQYLPRVVVLCLRFVRDLCNRCGAFA